jgi:hypothetical protein
LPFATLAATSPTFRVSQTDESLDVGVRSGEGVRDLKLVGSP